VNLFVRLAAAIAGGAAVYFAAVTMVTVLARRSAGRVAVAQALILEEQRRRTRTPLRDRVQHWLAVRGYAGPLAPVLAVGAVLFGFVALVLRLIGISGFVGLAVAVPIAAGVLWVVSGQAAARRKRLFDAQLLSALNMLAGLLEAGQSPPRALDHVAAAVAEPLRSELAVALDRATVDKDLVPALSDLARRYPSRAFDLFVTALEIERDVGAPMAPAIRQAVRILERDFELSQETNAEIAQARYEFYGILILLGFIAFAMYSGSDATARGAYLSPMGLLILAAATANMAFGLFRVHNIFRKADPRNAARPAPRRVEDQGTAR
jgi:Flp pilus assembly protein TadB